MGEDPCQGVHHPDQLPSDDTADRPVSWYVENIDVGPNLWDEASRGIVHLGLRIDRANRACAMLGELAAIADGRGALDVRVAGALKVVATACGVSPGRLRVAVADALDGVTPA